MIAARAALLAALLLAIPDAIAQPGDASDVAPALRGGVMAYRAGDLFTAEANLRLLAPDNPDAEAWLGVVLLDRGLNREALQAMQRAADSGFDYHFVKPTDPRQIHAAIEQGRPAERAAGHTQSGS